MFDYETESLWNAISGEAVKGALKGEKLKEITSTQKIPWKEWKRLHPDTKVLTHEGRESPGYDNYMNYHKNKTATGIVNITNKDNRLKLKETVIALEIDGMRKVYPINIFKKRKTISDTFQKRHLLVYHDQITNNTLVYNRMIGKTILEFPDIDNPSLHIEAADIITDKATGTKWNINSGIAVYGSLKGKKLVRIGFKNIYWFVWADHYPYTEIYKQ